MLHPARQCGAELHLEARLLLVLAAGEPLQKGECHDIGARHGCCSSREALAQVVYGELSPLRPIERGHWLSPYRRISRDSARWRNAWSARPHAAFTNGPK